MSSVTSSGSAGSIRRVLGLGTAQRNLSAALAISALNFRPGRNGHDPGCGTGMPHNADVYKGKGQTSRTACRRDPGAGKLSDCIGKIKQDLRTLISANVKSYKI